MLQKLENAYLAILRTVVIVASGILLVGVVMFGLGALKGFGEGPSDEIAPPKVVSSAVIEKIMPQEEMAAGAQHADEEPAASPESSDPNQMYYNAAAKSIVSFVVRVSGGQENPSESQIVDVIKDRAESIGAEEIKTAYAKGFSETIDKVVADKKIEALAVNTSPIDVVNKTLNSFSEEFNAQIKAEHERISVAQQEHIQAKAESASNLYIAAASFGMFLLVVFLSIFIKIERNLRHLEGKSPVGA